MSHRQGVGAKGDWDFRISDLVKKTLMELIFNACGEFRSSPEGPVSQIHSPHLLVGAPVIFSYLLRFVQMLKREWSAESNGKLPHLLIPSKTATSVPDFAMKDLPLGKIATLVSDLPLGRTLMMIQGVPKTPTTLSMLCRTSSWLFFKTEPLSGTARFGRCRASKCPCSTCQ